MPKQVVLGEVSTPSGALVVLDPGLARLWRHDALPCSPHPGDGDDFDLKIVGPDALAAGRAYDREFNPLYLFDVPEDLVQGTQEHFNEFATEHGLDARAERLSDRVPHVQRARLAMDIGEGIGVVTYNRMWAVACEGFPTTGTWPVVATTVPVGEWKGRWQYVDVVVAPGVEVATDEPVKGVMVDYAQSMFVDLDALGKFRAGKSLDGLGDFLFQGADAGIAAETVGAPQLGVDRFGWTDVPMAELDALAARTQRLRDEHGWRIVVAYRPHDNRERLNAQIRLNLTRAGTVLLDGVQACGFDNSWGDGLFTVSRGLSSSGELVRLRLELADEDRFRLMSGVSLATVVMRSRFAIVSRLVWDDGKPPRFIELEAEIEPDDSGWRILSDEESLEYADDPDNFRPVQVAEIIDRFPMFKDVIHAPVGSAFVLEDGRYVEYEYEDEEDD